MVNFENVARWSRSGRTIFYSLHTGHRNQTKHIWNIHMTSWVLCGLFYARSIQVICQLLQLIPVFLSHHWSLYFVYQSWELLMYYLIPCTQNSSRLFICIFYFYFVFNFYFLYIFLLICVFYLLFLICIIYFIYILIAG